MKSLAIFLSGVVFATCLIFGLHPAHAAEQSECFPLATLKVSFQVVFPEASQMTLDGAEAQTYLDEYNNFGRPTKFEGDSLFLNILPNGTTMLIPLDENGIGCARMIVGPKLYKVIMTKIARGDI